MLWYVLVKNPNFRATIGPNRIPSEDITACIILISIVVIFLICHTPRIIMNINEFINIEIFHQCKAVHLPIWALVTVDVSKFALILNSSISFFVYCLVGKRFRKELFTILGMMRRNQNNREIDDNDEATAIEMERLTTVA